MRDIFNDIHTDGEEVIAALGLLLPELRGGRSTIDISAKKALVYSYLYTERGYSAHAVANYCHKDHSTIIKMTQRRTELWAEHKHRLLGRIQSQKITRSSIII